MALSGLGNVLSAYYGGYNSTSNLNLSNSVTESVKANTSVPKEVTDSVELSDEVKKLLKQLAEVNQDSSISQLLGTGTQSTSLIGTLFGDSETKNYSLKGRAEASLFSTVYSSAMQAAYNGALQKQSAQTAEAGASRMQSILDGYNSYLNSLSAVNPQSSTGSTTSIIS